MKSTKWWDGVKSRLKRSSMPEPEDPFRKQLADAFSRAPWCLDHIATEGELVRLRGWIVNPAGRNGHYGLMVNDHLVDPISYPLERQGVAEKFWFFPDAAWSGFEATAPRSVLHEAAGEPNVIRIYDKAGAAPFPLECSYFWTDPASDSQPMPPPENRQRVHGSADLPSFLLAGRTLYHLLELALQRTHGRAFSDFDSILDWGCGCGRLIRNLPVPAERITGVDIDAENVAWCQDAFPGARFRAIDIAPPTPLESGRYDCLLGLSVFTHLRQADQLAWLEELARLARPGAVLMMSIHGEAAAARAGFNIGMWQGWKQAGFIDGRSDALKDVVSDEDYYRNSFHTVDYVMNTWGQFFTDIEILPGWFNQHHDLVVMRAP